MFNAQENTAHQKCKGGSEIGRLGIEQRSHRPGAAGMVHHDVEGSEPLHRSRDRGSHIGFDGHIPAGYMNDVRETLPNRNRARRLGQGRIALRDDDPGAFL